MGLSLPPDEHLISLAKQWPCRDAQLRQLSVLLSPTLPSPSTLVISGAQKTGKSQLISAYLSDSEIDHAIVQCRECVTGRHLMERTVGFVSQALQPLVNGDTKDYNGRCENLSALDVHLQKLLSTGRKFVLVFDDIDDQRDAPPTIVPALARLGETIPGLTVVLVVQHAPARLLHRSGVCHIQFSPYTREQSIHILSRSPLDIFSGTLPAEPDYDDEIHQEDKSWLWPRFCAAVWDATAHNAARDLGSFQEVCQKLWYPFVDPIVKGDFGTRDFSRLLVAQRRLFQEEDVLLASILPVSETVTIDLKSRAYGLPYFAKWLLIAAYLASFNPVRMDALYFMKATERRRRKKGGGTASTGRGRPSQNRKIPRHLLAASTFTLDRLLAILHAILPDDIRTTIDIYKQIAALTSLRFLQRASGIGSGDPLEAGSKWRVGSMVTWEYAQDLARTLDFTLADYLVE